MLSLTGRIAAVADDRRRFRLHWFQSGASNLADGVVRLALPLLAARSTESPALVAGAAFALMAPWLLFSLPVGVVVDRLDRRQVMLAGNALRVAALVPLAATAVAGDVALPILYGAAVALGIAEVLTDSAAGAILPSIVPTDRLETANARLVATHTVANELAGPPLGGLLAAASLAVALAAGAGLYAAAVAALLFLAGSFRPAVRARASVRADVAEGLRFLRRHVLLRTLALLVAVMNVGWAAWLAVLVLYVVSPGPVGLSESGYGILVAGIGVGGVAGAVSTGPVLRAIGRRWAILADIVGTVVMLGMPAVTANAWAIGAAAAVGGAGATMWNVVVLSIRQQVVPDELLGRVGAALRLAGYGSWALGALGAGVLAELTGVRAVFGVCAGLTVLLLVPFFAVVTRDAVDSALRRGQSVS
jgi:MFS family permease